LVNLFHLEYERGEAAAAKALAEGKTAAPAQVEVGRQADSELAPPASGKHCGAGSSGIAVDPYGNVYPCVQWRRAVGNLHEQSIAEIWAHSRGLTDIRELTAQVKTVLEGEADAALLNFCPGLAATSSGDPLAVYDGARKRVDAIHQVQAERGPTQGRALLPIIS
ncbi:MAG: SPASM domain-containing protein, partial [Acidobacteriota bacterium]